MGVCMCGFCNVWACECVVFLMCGCVCVCGFCDVCVCVVVCVGFVMCGCVCIYGCVYMWVL